MTMAQDGSTLDPLPNPLPRPDGELDELKRVWQPPSGFAFITAVNNTYIGLFYVGTALLFLVLGGILAIAMGDMYWKYKIALVLIPAVIYLVMLLPEKFPVHERVLAGVSYKDMLAEAGALGAFIALTMVVLQLGQILGLPSMVSWVIILALTAGYGFYTKSLGRPLFILFLLIMIPLATTELGVDSWITSLMGGEMARIGINAGWVLVYTSAIMLVLRMFAGGVAHRVSPLGLLAGCSAASQDSGAEGSAAAQSSAAAPSTASPTPSASSASPSNENSMIGAVSA